MCGLDDIQRGDYFGGEPIRRTEVEVRMGKPKNGKTASKDEVTGEIVKDGDDMVVDQIWKLCNMAFESCVLPKGWRSAVIVPLYKIKDYIIIDPFAC